MTGSPAPDRRLPGNRVYHVHWVPGTDRLHAVCHCAAAREFDDPIAMWDWLLAHPAGGIRRRGR